MAFVVIKDGVTKLLNVENVGPLDKLVDAIPDVMNKAESFVKSKSKKVASA